MGSAGVNVASSFKGLPRGAGWERLIIIRHARQKAFCELSWNFPLTQPESHPSKRGLGGAPAFVSVTARCCLFRLRSEQALSEEGSSGARPAHLLAGLPAGAGSGSGQTTETSHATTSPTRQPNSTSLVRCAPA